MIKKYSFREYSKDFSKIFNREKSKIKKILPRAKIEHIGSTAVEGLGGKGIVDIAVAVPKKEIKNSIVKLKKIHYDYLISGVDKNRKFLQKVGDKRVHIQLVYTNSPNWKKMINFRDYLRKNKDAAKEYKEIKKKAVKYAKNNGAKYRKYKSKFFDKI